MVNTLYGPSTPIAARHAHYCHSQVTRWYTEISYTVDHFRVILYTQPSPRYTEVLSIAVSLRNLREIASACSRVWRTHDCHPAERLRGLNSIDTDQESDDLRNGRQAFLDRVAVVLGHLESTRMAKGASLFLDGP